MDLHNFENGDPESSKHNLVKIIIACFHFKLFIENIWYYVCSKISKVHR